MPAVAPTLPGPTRWSQERIATGFVHEGHPVGLELLVARPAGPPPHPVLVFHHGSTGAGSDPALFGHTFRCEALAAFFNRRGWLVLFPQRRGRGRSDGRYDEGFTPDRSRYACEPALALAGLEHALQDLDAILAHVQARPDVQAGRVLVAGSSRGGALAIAHAGRHPQAYAGAISFNGGWLGRACPTHLEVNPAVFRRGAAFGRPSLWLHGSHDPYYRIAHCRDNFAAYCAAGGRGSFHGLRGGHLLRPRTALWAAHVDAYLASVP